MGYGFAGRCNEWRQSKQIKEAWAKGASVHKRTNTRVAFRGTCAAFWSFRGLTRFLTGQMEFWHYESRVLMLDFDKDLITDFGFDGHSPTTSLNIRGWMQALRAANIHAMYSLHEDLRPLEWTRTENNVIRGAGFHEDMWQRFRAGVPWVKKIGGVGWFHGPSFSRVRMDSYNRGRDDVLNDGVSWHWFTYDWDVAGNWSKRFIDATAERRWNKRQAKKAA